MKLTPEIYFREVPRVIDMTTRSELYFTNEFTFAVAVILSAQATDKKVNEVTPGLFAIADTPEKILDLGADELKKHIRVISFFNNKAKSILGLAAALVPFAGEGVDFLRNFLCEQKRRGSGKNNLSTTTPSVGQSLSQDYNKTPPTDTPSPAKGNEIREALMKLPGIGQKTANVIMNVLWGAPMIGVDTHVFRNAHRYGWVTAADNTPEKVEKKLLKLIPKKYHAVVNHVMVLHGRYICTARNPKCDQCPVAKWCPAKDKYI